MYKYFLLAIMLIPSGISTYAQNWVQKADYTGGFTDRAVSFSIGNKGYVINYTNLSVYDPATNSWTQKANFPGSGSWRTSAVGFSIGFRGYYGTGETTTGIMKDFWEYNSLSDVWSQKKDFPGGARYFANAFSIGNKGYLGIGNNNTGFLLNDFWEYNPAMDSFTKKANFPGIKRQRSVGFAIMNKGYITSGQDSSYSKYLKDLWEYNPANNSWVRKADLPDSGRMHPVGIGIGDKGYVGTGYDGIKYFKDFWEYAPSNNTWTQITNYGGAARMKAMSFAFGLKMYVGAGQGSGGVTKLDFWEYTQPCTTPIITIQDSNITKCVGEYKQFSISLTGSTPLSFQWYKNNVAISGATNQSYIINNVKHSDSGSYKCIVTNLCGGDTSIPAKLSVTPKADFTVNASDMCFKGNGFNFTNHSSAASGTISYNWTFGDGATSTNTNTFHSYLAADTFFVTLKASTSLTCYEETVKRIIVYPQPVIQFSVNDSIQCLKGNRFFFYNNSAILWGTLSYKWNFGDGAISANINPVHPYLTAGSFSVTLKAISNQGCIDSIKKSVAVLPSPVAAFDVQDTAHCLNKSFVFSNKSHISIGSIVQHNWKFGDGQSVTSFNSNHNYLNEGIYSVSLSVTSDQACMDSVSKIVRAYPMPLASFTVNDSIQCFNGNNFNFNNNSAIQWGTLSYLWNFGDGTNSAIKNPVHSYLTDGSFPVALKAISNQGCCDSISKPVSVLPSPVAAYDVPDTAQCLNNSFVFSNKSHIPNGSIVQHNWKFGDGQAVTSLNSNHNYLNEGSYTVSLSETSDQGCLDSVSKLISAYPMPDASFTVKDTVQCLLNNSFSFTNTSTISSGTLNTLWKSSDGTNSTLNNYLHSFSGFGIYTVKLLTTSGYNCKDSLLQTVYVNEDPVVDLGKDTILTDKQNITLDAGSGMDDYLWSDGSTTRQITIDTTGYGLGSHNIWVRVTKNDCTDEDAIIITFKKPDGIINSNHADVKVYPNPFSSKIYLEIPISAQEVKVRIVNVLGSEVYNANINSTAESSKTMIDLSWLTKGLYYLEISDQGYKRIEKLVKE
jgi:PKD repeat protein